MLTGFGEAAAGNIGMPLSALADRETAKKISPTAVKLFFRLAALWRLSIEQQRVLLGGISRQTHYNWREGKVGPLSRDQLERISLILGIHSGLKLLFADEASAERWFTAANHDVPFGGASPLARMTQGSIDDLYAVRRYIDAWRGMK